MWCDASWFGSGAIGTCFKSLFTPTMATLAPPSTVSTTTKKMDSPSSISSDAVSDSGRSSPNSSSSASPLISFDRPLDPSDPINPLIDPSAVDTHSSSGGDSSAEDSLCSSTPPSSHESPTGDWSATGPAPGKDSTDPLWQQPDFSVFSPYSFNSLGSMDFPLGFDSTLFPSDPLFSMDSSVNGTQSGVPTDVSSYAFNFGHEDVQNFGAPFTSAGERRSSITSSSSSGQPVSSMTDHAQAVLGPAPVTSHTTASALPPPFEQTQVFSDQLMDELAARARQIVGLTMALPVGRNPPSNSDNNRHQQLSGVAPPVSSVLASSVPAQPVPPTSSILSDSPSPTSTPPPMNARRKTSHTTIERRYRTNLNSRIQSLRAAVPALRVLEVKAGNRVGNLPLKPGTRRVGIDPGAQPGQEDVIDERGYIDGVKVARKGSKANVLGKAVEYIHVLKRREVRLKREQDGLKALVRSLVGGPELMQQWETMWRERFGGPEKDEMDGEDAEADDENDDGDDDDVGDDKEDRDEESFGKKRKRAKVDSLPAVKSKGKKGITVGVESRATECPQATQPIPIMPSHTYSNPMGAVPIVVPAQPEKRKRGRPRKVPLPPDSTPNGITQSAFAAPFAHQPFQQQSVAPAPVSSEARMDVDLTKVVPQSELQRQSQAHVQQPGQQYLLAAFAFFSFFNSPLSYYASSFESRSGHAHTHSGSVLGDPRPEIVALDWSAAPSNARTFGWRDAVQITHLTVSILLFLSIISPWVPRAAKYVPRSLRPIMGLSTVSAGSNHIKSSGAASENECANEGEKTDAEARAVLLSALNKGRMLAPVIEAQVLREALGLGTGVLGLLLSLMRQVGEPGRSRSRYGLEHRMLEQKAFLRFAELVALDANASMTTRIQTYIYSFKFFSIFSASVKDISTLALVIQPVSRAKSVSLWALALSRAQRKDPSSPHVCKAYETYILESMTVNEAALKVAGPDRVSAACAASAEADRPSDETEMAKEDMCHEPAEPLATLARQAIRDVVRKHAESVFLQTVTGDEADYDCGMEARKDDLDAAECEMSCIVNAGRSLDSRTMMLVDTFERVCNPTFASFASDALLDSEELELEVAGPSDDSADAELRALLRAIVLYRRIFPSTLLGAGAECRASASGSGPRISISLTPMPSPPPSPSRRDTALHLALRRCLDSTAFDRRDVLEDARDRIVDLLTAERGCWPKRLQY